MSTHWPSEARVIRFSQSWSYNIHMVTQHGQGELNTGPLQEQYRLLMVCQSQQTSSQHLVTKLFLSFPDPLSRA